MAQRSDKTDAVVSRETPTAAARTIPGLRELVARLCKAEPTIELGYLFGSAARVSLDDANDVDVAVGFGHPTDPLERLGVLGRIEDRLVAALRHPVDVVDLYRAPPILVHQILDAGRPAAFVRDERRRLEFENRARQVYFEMKRRYAVYDSEAVG